MADLELEISRNRMGFIAAWSRIPGLFLERGPQFSTKAKG